MSDPARAATGGLPVFGVAWAEAWGRELEASEAYRAAAAAWEGALALAVADDDRGVWADLWHGRCRAVRPLRPEDREASAFVLEAPLAVWQRVFEGRLDPLWAVVRRHLRVTHGRYTDLLPWAAAARELVAAARRVPTDFPPASATAEAEVSRAEGPATAKAVPAAAGPRRFQTTSPHGLDRESFPMKLWEKAKRRGVWNPSDIDFRRDREDWGHLDPLQRDVILRLTSLFQAGEESVTVDLLPLIGVVAAEGRLEEEIYLTSFLWEEAKHVDVFRRFFDEVAETREDLARYHSPSHRFIFHEALPEALGRLRVDPSPTAQAEASVTYNLVVEGVLAETGYHAFFEMLRSHGILPGLQEAIGWLQSDEARHLAYGVYLLSRLVAEHGDPVWEAIEGRMERLLPPALGVVEEAFAAYDTMPFGLDRGAYIAYATRQFEARLRRIERARSGDLGDEVEELGSAG